MIRVWVAALILVPSHALAEPEPRVSIDAGIVIGQPHGTYSDASISHGYDVLAAVHLAEHFAVFVGYQTIPLAYHWMSPNDGVHDAPLTIHQWDVVAGFRYTHVLRENLFGFGELGLDYTNLVQSSTDFAGDDYVESGLGVSLRAGVVAVFGDRFGFGAALGYSRATVSVQYGPNPAETTSWVTLGIFAHVGF